MIVPSIKEERNHDPVNVDPNTRRTAMVIIPFIAPEENIELSEIICGIIMTINQNKYKIALRFKK